MNHAITIEGNIATDPEFRFSRGGRPVLNFRVAVNDRRLDPAQNKWVDTKPVFHNVAVFNTLAENAAETVRKGMQVIVTGKLTNNDWTDDAGATHYRVDLVANNIGVGLMFATATVTKRTREQQPSAAAQEPAEAA
jgi:single-strand DNA-binding protein